MKDCKTCKNENICRWIDEREKVKVKLEKIALKEGCPFELLSVCSFFVSKEPEVEVLEEKIETEDIEIKEEVIEETETTECEE